MNENIFGFILTILAGLSTMIGTILIFIFKKKKDNIILSSLAFAGGVMLSVSIIDLIPEGYNLLKSTFYQLPAIIISLIAFSFGILLSIFVDKCFPTIENKLYKVGIFSMIAIILHNIPEGIATFLATTKEITLGLSIAISIALHNIPEGISISVPIYYATNSKKKAFLYTLISGISEPFGALLAYFFLQPIINDTIMGVIFFIIAGIMTHISCYELIPTSLNYKNKKLSLIFFAIGIIFILFNHFILSI